MVLKYIPETCRDVESGRSGFLQLKMLSYPERNRLRKEVGISFFDESGEKTFKEKLERLEVAATMAEKIFPLIESVHLEVNGTKIGSADDLYSHPDCEDIVTELIMKYMFGFAEKNS